MKLENVDDIAQLRKEVYQSLINEGWDVPEAWGLAETCERLLAGVMGLRPVIPRPRPTPPASDEELAYRLGLPRPRRAATLDEKLRSDLDALRADHAVTDSVTDRLVARVAGIEHRLDGLNTPTPTPAPAPSGGVIRIGDKVINTALIRYIERDDRYVGRDDEVPVTVYFVGEAYNNFTLEGDEATTLWQHMTGER
ncbi:MAG: hypothetical protein EI684_15150 [Candidatus Viridilinea halotolerans]|uniref:Uncharacterized protein n=1 Tax=Candidatus Viridilinea halotolerans TaxID=2491704 RepID=A0A426TVX6_9CHLR|nr:MAG: hypothetical protein EI684_15150 [Candidatus Viridilinea halotolerans]